MPEEKKKKISNKPKKEVAVQVRINEIVKEEWVKFAEDNNFPSISQLIRFAVNEIIEKGIKTTTKNSYKNKTEQLQETRDHIEDLQKERLEYMGKINDILSEMREKKDVKIEHNIKSQVLKLLEKHPYRSEDIAGIFNIEESEILITLNDLIKKKIIKLNKNMEYEVLNNGSSN